MSNTEYGINKIKIGEDNVESTFVKFGDGVTRISSVHWDDKEAGVQICRSNKVDNTPFKEHGGGEEMNELPDDDKVYIVFDNVKSLDIMVAKLTEARTFLTTDKG
jgi:hypothetical protein